MPKKSIQEAVEEARSEFESSKANLRSLIFQDIENQLFTGDKFNYDFAIRVLTITPQFHRIRELVSLAEEYEEARYYRDCMEQNEYESRFNKDPLTLFTDSDDPDF